MSINSNIPFNFVPQEFSGDFLNNSSFSNNQATELFQNLIPEEKEGDQFPFFPFPDQHLSGTAASSTQSSSLNHNSHSNGSYSNNSNFSLPPPTRSFESFLHRPNSKGKILKAKPSITNITSSNIPSSLLSTSSTSHKVSSISGILNELPPLGSIQHDQPQSLNDDDQEFPSSLNSFQAKDLLDYEPSLEELADNPFLNHSSSTNSMSGVSIKIEPLESTAPSKVRYQPKNYEFSEKENEFLIDKIKKKIPHKVIVELYNADTSLNKVKKVPLGCQISCLKRQIRGQKERLLNSTKRENFEVFEFKKTVKSYRDYIQKEETKYSFTFAPVSQIQLQDGTNLDNFPDLNSNSSSAPLDTSDDFSKLLPVHENGRGTKRSAEDDENERQKKKSKI